MSESQSNPPPKFEGGEIDVHYVKSNQHRTIHVDGMLGSVAPSGDKVVMSLYTERHPIPRVEAVVLDANGRVMRKEVRDSKSGILREMDATLIMDHKTLKAVIKWLHKKDEEMNAIDDNLTDQQE